MSLLRLTTTRPLAALRGAPVRALSTTVARNQRDPTSDLFKTVMSTSDIESQDRPNYSRFQPRQPQQQSRDPASPTPRSSPSPSQYAHDMLQQNMPSTAAEVDFMRLRGELEGQMQRRWQAGDVYSPHDLTGVEAKKWRRTKRIPSLDAFETLALNPLNEYKNFAIMSEYITEMGRIKHSNASGLKPKNHRKVAKAIRRAIGIGIMPSIHVHPELIKPSHGAPPT
ncbi:mitochondrial 37s ribosomal protein rsm18 [Diplodia corticola]|uniref:Small ribosomal subunit protein bS18m n=1 Tax=Diplodia corticola TaxID=236234 RepID=A0A1J9QQ15_9PEZI|nr:mitochondrial 37s ribosomal protein rsm18 [Diplodia corticola]OJD30545.1 mitochondrial 37s ribosomal protein rsm18 [Diplodia corticola]